MNTAQPLTELGKLNCKYIAVCNQINQERGFRAPLDLIDQKVAIRNSIVERQNELRTRRQRAARIEEDYAKRI